MVGRTGMAAYSDPMLIMQVEVPEDIQERASQIIDTVKADPTLLAILVIVGILTAAIFVWGMVRQVFKAALFAGLASAGIWYWYFNIR
jgi:hypothetical protein